MFEWCYKLKSALTEVDSINKRPRGSNEQTWLLRWFCSSLIRVVSLVLNVGERGECPCAQTIKLILEEHDLLLLLFDYVDHSTLVSDSHDLLARVVSWVVVGCRFQIDNLLSLIDLHAQIACLTLKFSVLTLLVLDLLKKLLLLGGKSLQAVSRVLLKLTDLIIKTLLVVLILLLVLALNNLLSLFGDSVELYVKCSLLVVLNLQVQTLHLVFDLL